MLQATENDLLRNAAGQFAAPQLIQDQIRALGGNGNPLQAAPASDSSHVSLSDASKLLNSLQSQDKGAHPLLSAISKLVQLLTGQKVDNINLSSQKLEASSFRYDSVEEALKVGGRSGLDYRYRAVHAEAQQVSYSAQGSIKLEDGTELTFDFKLEISRVYVEETQARVQIDGSQLRDALGSNLPGLRANPRASGFDVDLDHRGVRHLLEGAEDVRRGYGRDRGNAHEHNARERVGEVSSKRSEHSRKEPRALEVTA